MGAGVTGLTCAIRLAEAGHRVDVLARDLPLETTSVVAAALWYPYLAEPRERVVAWGADSYRVFADLAAEEGAGVRMMPGTEVLPERTEDPWWASAVPDLEHVAPPAGYADAWSFTAPVVDMPVYLRWLRARLECLGGTLTRISLGALPPADRRRRRQLLGAGLAPARPGPHDATGPRAGGARWRGSTSTGGRSTRPGRRTSCRDRARSWSAGPSSRGLEPDPVPGDGHRHPPAGHPAGPRARGARVVGHRVGLRPARAAVRLEAEGRTVHCYGQGGAGVTLSWGCAAEVTGLVQRARPTPGAART